jgi:hypothetical protein
LSDLARQLGEDKALRDAALQLFKSDIALIRGDLDERGIGARVRDRVGGAALEMVDDAIDYAEEKPGRVAAGAAAVVLWFARKPILRWLADLLDSEEPGTVAGRSDDDSDSTGETR